MLRGGLGRTQTGERALDLVSQGLATTSFLLFVGLGGGFPLGVAWTRFERQRLKFATRVASIEITGEPAMLQSSFIHGIKRLPCAWS